jgi:hypothetical protein
MFGAKRLILGEGRVDRIGIKAMKGAFPGTEILAENGGNKTLSDASFSLED